LPCEARAGSIVAMALNERDRAVLEIEAGWWLEGSCKGDVVRARLGCSLSTYRRALERLRIDPEARSAYPLVVHRLDERARARARRRAGAESGGARRRR
jgi:hypothetical protein